MMGFLKNQGLLRKAAVLGASLTLVAGLPAAARAAQISKSLQPGQYSAYNVSGPYTGLYRENGSRIGSLDSTQVFGWSDHVQADLLWFCSGWMTWNYSLDIPTQSKIKSLSYTAEVSSEYPGSNLNWPSNLNVSFNGVKAGAWAIPGDPSDSFGYQENHLWNGASQYGWLTTWTVDDTGTYLEYKFRKGDAPKVKISDVTISDLKIEAGKDISVTLSVPYSQSGGGLNLYGDTWGDYNYDPTVTVEYQSVPEPSTVLGILAFGTAGAGSLLKRKQKATCDS
jgi:predicted transcriptional regulator